MKCQTIELHIYIQWKNHMGNYIKFESVLGVQDQVGFIFVEFADDF